jgi:CheY-like chemotaxis protein
MKKILLLDDNTIACERSIRQLERKYEVCRCKEILIAARRLKIIKFDLLIIDLMMPTKGLNTTDEFNAGFAFYNQYVNNDRKGIPVIFWTNLSNNSFNAFYENHQQSNLLHYLQKSDDEMALLNLVNQLI